MSDARSGCGGGGGGFLLGLLLGLLAGTALGLLLSPRPGRDNRDLLLARLPRVREEGPALRDRVVGEIRKRLEDARRAYREAASETRERMRRELEASRRTAGPPVIRPELQPPLA